MDFVVDANIIFATLIKDGETARLLLNENNRFFAPEYLLAEILEHRAEILSKTKRTSTEFDEIISILKNLINIIPQEEYISYEEQAQQISPDEDDFPYFALALKLQCPIWSNDKELKSQDKIRIYSTEDLIK